MSERPPYAVLGMRRPCDCGERRVCLNGNKPSDMVAPAEGEDPNDYPTAAQLFPTMTALCAGCGKDALDRLYAIPHDPIETDANEYDAGDTTDYPYTGT